MYDNQVIPVTHMLFPNNNAIFQDDSSLIHTAESAQSWFEMNEDALQHLTWPAQWPDLNIIEPLWSVLENMVRSRFPPISSLHQLDVLHEEMYNIAIESIQNLLESITRMIEAVL